MSPSYFEVLELPWDANYVDVHAAYARLRKKYAADEARLEEIERAYRTLINPTTRRRYIDRGPQAYASPDNPGSSASPLTTGSSPFDQSPEVGRQGPVGGKSTVSRPQQAGGDPQGRQKTVLFDAGSDRSPREDISPRRSDPSSPATPPTDQGARSNRQKTQIINPGAGAGGESSPRQPPAIGGKQKTEHLDPSGMPRAADSQQPSPKPSVQSTSDVAKQVGRTGGPRPNEPQPRQPTQVLGDAAPPFSEGRQGPPPATPPSQLGRAAVGSPAQPPKLPDTKHAKVTPPARTALSQDDTRMAPESFRDMSDETTVLAPLPAVRFVVELSYGGSDVTIELSEGDNLVGRPPRQGPPPAVPLPDEKQFISRHHAILRVDAGECSIVDQGSDNGTYLNGRRLKAFEVYPLSGPGDVVSIEKRQLRVRPI